MAKDQAELYINLYKQLHTKDPYYGTTSIRWLPLVQHYVSDLDPESILDFGCGKSRLIEHIRAKRDISRYRYDPAVAEYAMIPADKVGMVLNIDVMEHIPESAVDDVLQSIRSLSDKVFFNISCQPAWNKLPDGSNAHCTVYPPEWWKQKLKKHFEHVDQVEWDSVKNAIFVTWQVKSHYASRHKLWRKIRHNLINLFCLFVPVRSWRHRMRDKFFNV